VRQDANLEQKVFWDAFSSKGAVRQGGNVDQKVFWDAFRSHGAVRQGLNLDQKVFWDCAVWSISAQRCIEYNTNT